MAPNPDIVISGSGTTYFTEIIPWKTPEQDVRLCGFTNNHGFVFGFSTDIENTGESGMLVEGGVNRGINGRISYFSVRG